jgi:hypothetical protein
MDNETATLMQQITAFEKQLQAKPEAGSSRHATEVQPTPEEAKLAADMAEVAQILAGFGGPMMMDVAPEPGCGEAGMDEMELGMMMDESPVENGMMQTEDGLDYMDVSLSEGDLIEEDFDEPALMASVADPSGIEEEITDDHFSEVSRVTGDDDIPDAQHTIDVAPTELAHTANMKEASQRLDRLAQYIEQKVAAGEDKKWLKVAYRIDQMADSIDAQIKTAQEAE